MEPAMVPVAPDARVISSERLVVTASEAPDWIWSCGAAPPDRVRILPFELALNVTAAALMIRSRPIVWVGTLVIVGDGVTVPSITRMSFVAGEFRAGGQLLGERTWPEPV